MATSLYKLVLSCSEVVEGGYTSLYKLMLSCSEVVGGGYKYVQACVVL